MVTKEQAATARTFYHVRIKNSDGSAARCRASGALKTWKTRPDDWRLPVKHGLRDSFYLSPSNAHEWTTEEPVNAQSQARARKTLAKRLELSPEAPDYALRDKALEMGVPEHEITEALGANHNP